MELRLEFVGTDAVPRRAFRLDERDGGYQLPQLVATANGQAWLEDATIVSVEVLEGAELVESALRAAWRDGPSGRGSRLSSPPCRLAAEHVTEPVEVRVTWRVTWYDRGLYERYVNSAEPFLEEGSVNLSFQPAPTVTTQQAVKQDATWLHRGHVALDYGTSYCTATLFEQQYLPPPRPLSQLQAAQLRTAIIGLLDHGVSAAPPDARREFAEIAAEVAVEILGLPPGAGAHGADPVAALRQALAEDDYADPRLLYTVLPALERRVPDSSEALRPALAAALNDIYNTAWKIPPLDRLRLFEVMLDPNEGSVVESKATATAPPLTVTIGRGTDEDNEGGPETHIYAGLKQRLGNAVDHPELGPNVTSDDLIREALRYLLGRCNAFVQSGPRELGTGPIANVAITFPTMATPPMRRKLRDMLHSIDVPHVDNSIDEAIAAAMFTILQDFGSDFDTGLELLRAQSRTVVPGSKWTQNLLIVDIGGGTTDIALLGLHLHDETPEEVVKAARDRHGRYYELIPEVLGSTGKLQLGGELMTLRVFYWIKALLGDRLLKVAPQAFGQPLADLRLIMRSEPGADALLKLTRGKLPTLDRAYGGDAFEVLDRVVPTRSSPDYGRPSQAFWLLWRIADRVKLDFCKHGAPDEITLRAAEVRRMLQVADWPRLAGPRPALQSIENDDLAILLTRADFERLVTPDIQEIMRLAHRLAADRLAGSAAGAEPLDRIILTGQASRAPLVRSTLLSVFGEEKAISWQPKSVSVVEGQFAKLATSLGACWTKSNKGAVSSPKGARAELLKGRNMFRINADNLFFNLPCTFLRSEQLGGSADAPEILRIGTEMFQTDPSRDLAALRSEPFELKGTVAIFRDAHLDRPRWADFQWEYTAREQGLTLDPRVWPTAITARVETTSGLDMTLLLCRGRPHYEVSGAGISVQDAVAAALGAAPPTRPKFWQRTPPARQDGEQQRPFDPSRIVVNALAGDGNHRGTVIFRPADADALEASPAIDDAFPETFHLTDGRRRETVLVGAVSAPLPEPPSDAPWTFHYLDDKGGAHHIGELAPPPREGTLAIRYYASVDAQGALRVHAGEIPFWKADSLADVQDRPGSVHRAPMLSTSDDYEPERDPFNGRH